MRNKGKETYSVCNPNCGAANVLAPQFCAEFRFGFELGSSLKKEHYEPMPGAGGASGVVLLLMCWLLMNWGVNMFSLCGLRLCSNIVQVGICEGCTEKFGCVL